MGCACARLSKLAPSDDADGLSVSLPTRPRRRGQVDGFARLGPHVQAPAPTASLVSLRRGLEKSRPARWPGRPWLALYADRGRLPAPWFLWRRRQACKRTGQNRPQSHLTCERVTLGTASNAGDQLGYRIGNRVGGGARSPAPVKANSAEAEPSRWAVACLSACKQRSRAKPAGMPPPLGELHPSGSRACWFGERRE
jgi:hypothetical protein